MPSAVVVTGLESAQKAIGAFFEVPDKDAKTILRNCGKKVAHKILKSHYDRNQSRWAKPSEKYARTKQKRGKPQLVRTGQMMTGIQNEKAPGSLRKIRVSKMKKENVYRVSIALAKMVKGKNVYTYAQKGVASHAHADTKGKLVNMRRKVTIEDLKNEQRRLVKNWVKAKRAGSKQSLKSYQKANGRFKNVNVARERARMVCENEPGDEQFFADNLANAMRDFLTRKAKRMAKAAKK